MEKTKKIFFGLIPVTEKTYCKWEKVKYNAKQLAVPMFIGGTIGAAWTGYVNSLSNTIHIDELQKQVDHNAKCSIYDRSRIEDLERQANVLLEKALDVTEGKKEDSAA